MSILSGKRKDGVWHGGDPSVKVAVRVRPLLSKEILHNYQECVRLVQNANQVIIGKDHVFTFDFVFGKNSTQEEVYAVCIKPLLVSLTEGYNATVFAYGQTGSGKTYTIGGEHIASVAVDERGIIPRAIQELFHHISEHRNINFHVKVSYIEIYKEELRDLLDLETSVKDLHIREDEKGNTVIVGSKEFEVECADEVINLLERGNAARHTGTTQMNKRSSRSHAIFTISIHQKQSAEYQNAAQDSISSKFHFVDLAGSERVAKTGNTGERFKESVKINSGLFALGNVISALGDPKRKSAHIPYRAAKITRILKDSLGGNAKTVMITCISPSSLDFDESLNSLKYANRAKNIRNKLVVNYNPEKDGIDEMEPEVRLLREALQDQQVSNQHLHDLNEEKGRISSLEEQLTRLQVQYSSYRNCVDEALLLLVDLNDDVSLRRSRRDRLQSWISMVQKVRKEALTVQKTDTGTETSPVPHHITVLQQKRDLEKCQQVLARNEELFSQKNHEVQILQDQTKALLQEKKEQKKFLKEGQETQRLQGYTSPPVLSLAQIMAEFHIRRQIILSKLEDQDKVLHCHLPDQSDKEEDNTGCEEKTSYKRSINRTGTQNHASLCFLPDVSDMKYQVDKSDLLNTSALQTDTNTGEEIDSLQNSHVINMQKLTNSELRLAKAEQKISKLALNIKRKVELIKDLVRTGKDAQSLSRQCSMKISQLEQEIEQAKTQLSETQKQLQEPDSKELRDIPVKVMLQEEGQKKTEAAKLKVQKREARELEQKVAQMKHQQSQIQERLCEESEKKKQLEAELQQDQQQIKEEHILFQLEEGIETLVAAIDYKNESIHNHQHLLRLSSQSLSQSQHNVIGKLVSLSAAELRAIITSYFNKIIGLRESERKLQVQIEEQEIKSIHQKNMMHELESALEHIKVQCHRQLTHQRQEHERKIQFILKNFKEQNSEGTAETLKGYEVKIQQLEKDLFFYKKTSRELKKKLKSLLGESSE
ncbi:kinesin-like protein KIF27 isoform X1 [Taeniopygia guttata]|uniref:kinesin-like protein KIF27 isoform X1 n=1 Tax=Taeniopygia guttata TaxID=59729 RepID=UPI003BB980FF